MALFACFALVFCTIFILKLLLSVYIDISEPVAQSPPNAIIGGETVNDDSDSNDEYCTDEFNTDSDNDEFQDVEIYKEVDEGKMKDADEKDVEKVEVTDLFEEISDDLHSVLDLPLIRTPVSTGILITDLCEPENFENDPSMVEDVLEDVDVETNEKLDKPMIPPPNDEFQPNMIVDTVFKDKSMHADNAFDNAPSSYDDIEDCETDIASGIETTPDEDVDFGITPVFSDEQFDSDGVRDDRAAESGGQFQRIEVNDVNDDVHESVFHVEAVFSESPFDSASEEISCYERDEDEVQRMREETSTALFMTCKDPDREDVGLLTLKAKKKNTRFKKARKFFKRFACIRAAPE